MVLSTATFLVSSVARAVIVAVASVSAVSHGGNRRSVWLHVPTTRIDSHWVCPLLDWSGDGRCPCEDLNIRIGQVHARGAATLAAPGATATVRGSPLQSALNTAELPAARSHPAVTSSWAGRCGMPAWKVAAWCVDGTRRARPRSSCGAIGRAHGLPGELVGPRDLIHPVRVYTRRRALRGLVTDMAHPVWVHAGCRRWRQGLWRRPLCRGDAVASVVLSTSLSRRRGTRRWTCMLDPFRRRGAQRIRAWEATIGPVVHGADPGCIPTAASWAGWGARRSVTNYGLDRIVQATVVRVLLVQPAMLFVPRRSVEGRGIALVGGASIHVPLGTAIAARMGTILSVRITGVIGMTMPAMAIVSAAVRLRCARSRLISAPRGFISRRLVAGCVSCASRLAGVPDEGSSGRIDLIGAVYLREQTRAIGIDGGILQVD